MGLDGLGWTFKGSPAYRALLYGDPDQECHSHHPHLLLDPLHEGAGACAGEAKDGRSSLSDIATSGFDTCAH